MKGGADGTVAPGFPCPSWDAVDRIYLSLARDKIVRSNVVSHLLTWLCSQIILFSSSVGLVCGCLLEHTVVEPSRTESPSHSVMLCCSVLNIILANSMNSVCGGQHCCSWSCSCRSLLVQALQ